MGTSLSPWRTVVKELKDRPPEGANAVVTREREQLRAAGHARCCPPRHPKLLQPSSLELQLVASFDVASNICSAPCPPFHRYSM